MEELIIEAHAAFSGSTEKHTRCRLVLQLLSSLADWGMMHT